MKTTLILAAILASLAGCSTTSMSGSSYSGQQMQSVGELQRGTVLQIRNVIADRSGDSNSSYAGGALGGVVGAAAGNSVGHGAGRQLATVLGGAVGALGGSELTKSRQKVEAWELVVQLEGGRAISVVQEADGYPMIAGQRVYVSNQGGRPRVLPMR